MAEGFLAGGATREADLLLADPKLQGLNRARTVEEAKENGGSIAKDLQILGIMSCLKRRLAISVLL